MKVHIATEPAPGHDNEDFAAASPNGIVLVDGAGLAGVDDGGCVHGVAWYARQLGTAVLAALDAPGACCTGVPALLHDAIAAVAAAHRDTCDLTHPGSPSATVVIARFAHERLSYLVLADSTLIVRHGDEHLVVTDDREAVVGAPVRGGVPDSPAVLRDYVAAMRRFRNVPGGFWVAAADPEAAFEAVTGSVPLSEVSAVALLSDGAARIVDHFKLLDWPTVMEVLAANGPAALIALNRDAERTDPECARWPRGKPYDDSTAVYCTDPEDPVSAAGQP